MLRNSKFALIALCACVSSKEQPRAPVSAPKSGWPLIAKAEVAKRAMVASAHPLASEVGKLVLSQGGNAVDAAVAVGFALAVVHPEAGNLGGGGFMVLRRQTSEVSTLDFRETAPGAATRDMYLDEKGELTNKSLVGHLAAGVPGSVAGLAEAQAKHGKLKLSQVIAPAIKLAQDGFKLDAYRADSLAYAAEKLARFETSQKQFLKNGEAPAQGSLLVQPDLAKTLTLIAKQGANAFYKGDIAKLIVAEMKRGGGLISMKDLASYKAVWRDPIKFEYRGHTIYSMPPPSSGGVTMAQIFKVYERLGPAPRFGSAAQVHAMSEAMRRAFTDRNHYLGDPDFIKMPLSRLLSAEYADAQTKTISKTRATPTADIKPGLSESTQTTHYSVVDGEGNAVSVTTTINGAYGNYVTVAGAGFLLNNEMDDFAAKPGTPNAYGLVQGENNAIAPGKRMLSSMSPSIVTKDGKLLMVVGTPGGSTIITTVAQVISNVLDHKMSLKEAVAAPRVHHQALPDKIFFERGLSKETQKALETMGHTVAERKYYSGFVAAIIKTADGLQGVTDPRGAGGTSGL